MNMRFLTAFASLALVGCNAEPTVTPSKPSPPTAVVSDSPAVTVADSAESPAEKLPSVITEPAKPPATPSAEQIAKWGVSTEQPLQLLTYYDGFSDARVQCMAIAPNGKQFVLGGVKLTLWNVTESKPTVDLLATYKNDQVERPILSVGISPDGELLAAGDHNGMLRVWKMSDQSELFAIPAHDGRLTQLAFSPDSKSLATTSYSGEVRLWQTTDGKRIQSLKVGDQEVARLIFLSDSQLATAGGEAAIWNVKSGEKTATLTTGNVIGPALGLSSDRRWLVFADSDSQTKFWDVEKGTAAGLTLPGAGAHLIEFSPDGKLIATYSSDSTIRIWDAARRSVVQVIDADGGRTAALAWLPESNALVVASEQGRVRIWGTPDTAKSLGVEPIAQPVLREVVAGTRRPYSAAQFHRVIDVRSFPRLPDAVPTWSHAGSDTYNTPASQSEAELFYRHYLGNAGWEQIARTASSQPGLNFRKDGCELDVSLSPASPPPPSRAGDLQVTLRFAGNYDVRWLPKISAINSDASWDSFSHVGYRTKTALTDLEVAILKQFHEAGWTAYARLDASSSEDPRTRTISMLQGGSELTVFFGYPADSTEELFVQTGVNVTNKALPIPPDSGWIEFDSSTDLKLVANTKMDLKQTIAFFDQGMALDGWLTREAGRHVEDKQSWLPYLRGQQDVLIRLVTLPDGRTRIIVGQAERSSWQLKTPQPAEAATEQVGIQAADFQLPKGASAVRFDVDQKLIQFELADFSAPQLAEQFIRQMEALGWKRDGAGILSDEYSFITYAKDKAEIQLRARGQNKKATAMIRGDGLLWSKPLPTPPVRISYEAWLRRNRKDATLDLLDEFVEEMHKIPASSGKAN